MKGAGLQWVEFPPGNWFAPPGRNRSGGEGNQTVGAFGVEGHVSNSVSVQAVTRMSAEQARKKQLQEVRLMLSHPGNTEVGLEEVDSQVPSDGRSEN